MAIPTWTEDAHGRRSEHREEVVVEEPLEIRVAGERVAFTMRTPGEGRELAFAFLFAEGLINGLADVGSLYPCGRRDDASYGNVLELTPGPGVSLDLERMKGAQRSTLTTSACGVCGRDGVDDLLARIHSRTPASSATLCAKLVRRVPLLLARGQTRFSR